MNKTIFTLTIILLTSVSFANENAYKYKVTGNSLELFGHKLKTNHLPNNQGDHYVEFSESPDNYNLVILSYLHLQGKYNAWLYNKITKEKPTEINALHAGRHPQLKWHSNEVFEIAWAGMGYYTAAIYNISDIDNGIIVNDPVIIDPKNNIYVSYIEDPLETGLVVNNIFNAQSKGEIFIFELPEAMSVIDRYESISEVFVKDGKLVIKYNQDGNINEHVFYPTLLNKSSNN
ncbi:MAG: hypothetical protein OQK82_01480 [Candidatus Pacearchaeota archaeon]|nr:hypothetical protein [Candidatus Pacearchaeota archaeon]